jgi:hypothetical protein
MALKQADVDFFRPLWRRVLATAIVVAWFAYETLFSHDQLWIAVTGVAVGYCVWNFFLRYPKDKQDPPGTTGDGTPPAAS